MEEQDKFIEWLEIGKKNNWVTEPFCSTHDGDPFMSEEEAEQWEEGGDPCCFVIKALILQ